MQWANFYGKLLERSSYNSVTHLDCLKKNKEIASDGNLYIDQNLN